MLKLAIVTQVSPLRVRVNGDTADTPAAAMSDFSDATAGTTEALVTTVEKRRFAWRVQ
jgi:hypothetical protein